MLHTAGVGFSLGSLCINCVIIFDRRPVSCCLWYNPHLGGHGRTQIETDQGRFTINLGNYTAKSPSTQHIVFVLVQYFHDIWQWQRGISFWLHICTSTNGRFGGIINRLLNMYAASIGCLFPLSFYLLPFNFGRDYSDGNGHKSRRLGCYDSDRIMTRSSRSLEASAVRCAGTQSGSDLAGLICR